MQKLLLAFQTIRHLRPIQIQYQLWYRIRRKCRKIYRYKYSLSKNSVVYPVILKKFNSKPTSLENHCFTFLNQSVSLKANEIDWNIKIFGKLWEYNLNYFDFLLQPNMQKERGEQLIENFIAKLNNKSTALDPYPIALRGINWIKFFSQTSTTGKTDSSKTPKFNYSNSLFAQYQILYDNLEYHLLGNHLLEDGFSLLFGAFYFKNEILYYKAVEIIESELEEQILNDGAHFELSPMYHQIILDRLLDCINLVQNNELFTNQKTLLIFMSEKAKRMIKWLNCMTFANGQIPLLNDSAHGIAPTTNQLNQYAIRLGIVKEKEISTVLYDSNLSDSGYRKFNGANYECIIDIGAIGPSYQPGHSHADTFSFVLNVYNQPCIIDPGISTYEANEIRLKERGTASHNTVTINDQNSSGVWSSFRVAHRANVTIDEIDEKKIIARHDGFRKQNTIHQRAWEFDKEKIQIIDSLNGLASQGKAHIWFAPSVKPILSDHCVIIDNMSIVFENAEKVELFNANIPAGYNKHADNYKLEITFRDQLKTILIID